MEQNRTNMRSSLEKGQHTEPDRQGRNTIEHSSVLNETNRKGIYFYDASFCSFLLIFSVLMF